MLGLHMSRSLLRSELHPFTEVFRTCRSFLLIGFFKGVFLPRSLFIYNFPCCDLLFFLLERDRL